MPGANFWRTVACQVHTQKISKNAKTYESSGNSKPEVSVKFQKA